MPITTDKNSLLFVLSLLLRGSETSIPDLLKKAAGAGTKPKRPSSAKTGSTSRPSSASNKARSRPQSAKDPLCPDGRQKTAFGGKGGDFVVLILSLNRVDLKVKIKKLDTVKAGI